MNDGFKFDLEHEVDHVHCAMCRSTWWRGLKYIPPRRGFLGLFKRREHLTARCGKCGYVAKWRPGTIDVDKSAMRFF